MTARMTVVAFVTLELVPFRAKNYLLPRPPGQDSPSPPDAS